MHSFTIGTLLIFAALSTWVPGSGAQDQTSSGRETTPAAQADGLAAWQQMYSVLTHPRCINCHTATNHPQQGDDRRRHFANVVRGPAGKRTPRRHSPRG